MISYGACRVTWRVLSYLVDYYLCEGIKITFHRRRQHEIRRRFYIFLLRILVRNFVFSITHCFLFHSLNLQQPRSRITLFHTAEVSIQTCMLCIYIRFDTGAKDIALLHKARPLSGKILLAI